MTTENDKGDEQKTVRWDSIQNAFSGLGSTRDPAAHTRSRAGRILTDAQIHEQYMHGIGRVIVDRRPEDCTRRGWKIEVGDATDGVDPFATVFEDLGVKFKLRDAHRKARLWGGAGVVMILDDDGALDEPIAGQVRGIKALHVFNARELVPNTYFTDLEHPHFGKPRTYFLHPNKRYAATTSWNDVVHADRVIRFEGMDVPEEFAYSTWHGWGQSVIDSVSEEIFDVKTTAQALVSAVHQSQFGVLKLKNLAALLTGGSVGKENENLIKRLDAVALSKSLINAIVLDTSEEYSDIQRNFSGLIEAFSVAQQNLSAVTRYPLTLLYGQAPKGFSGSDDTGLQNYYDAVRADQQEFFVPAIKRIATILMQVPDGPTKGRKLESWSVKCHDLDTPNELEEAQARKTHAEADAINIDRGVYSPRDARQRYTGAGFSADLVVSSDDSDLDYETAQGLLDQVKNDTLRSDTYDGPSDPSLPETVKTMSSKKRKQWVDVFNRVFNANSDLEDTTREEKAFREAYAAVQNE